MIVFVITRADKVDYDEYAGFVVVAGDKPHARALAAARAYDEWNDDLAYAFLDPARSTCEIVDSYTPRIVFSDFRAG